MDLYEDINNIIPIEQQKIEIVGAMHMISSAIPRPKVLMEIGSYYGGSLALLGSLLTDDGLLISIDPQLQVSLMTDEIQKLIGGRELVHITGYSSDVMDQVTEVLDGREINVLMIDGDHTVEGTRADWTMYSPLVSHPGVILLHDICDQYELGPGVVFDEVSRTYGTGVIALQTHHYGIGVVYA